MKNEVTVFDTICCNELDFMDLVFVMNLSLQEKFNKLACEATGLGYRLEIHIIGDAAADCTLEGLKAAKVAPEKRPLLTHCQV